MNGENIELVNTNNLNKLKNAKPIVSGVRTILGTMILL